MPQQQHHFKLQTMKRLWDENTVTRNPIIRDKLLILSVFCRLIIMRSKIAVLFNAKNFDMKESKTYNLTRKKTTKFGLKKHFRI